MNTVARARPDVRIGITFATLLLALALGQLLRVPVFATAVKSAPILGIDIAVALLWLSLLVQIIFKSTVPEGSTSLLAVTFAVWALTGDILTAVRYDFSTAQFLFSAGYLARWLFYFGVYAWARVHFDNVDGLVRALSVLRTTILVIASFGILQAAFLPNFAFIVYPNAVPYETWDPQGNRLVSTLLDPNFAGSLIGMGALLSLPRALRRVPHALTHFTILLIAVFLTASRGAVLGFMAGALVLLTALKPSGKIRLGMQLTAALLVAVAVAAGASWFSDTPGAVGAVSSFLRNYNKLTVTDPSALTRILQWKTDLDVVASHPLTGIGFNTWGFVQRFFGFYRVDNAAFGMDGGLLVIAALTGIIGLTIFLTMASLPIARGFRIARQPSLPNEIRDLGASVAGSTTLWLMQGFFVATLTYPFLLVIVWLLWAWVDNAWKHSKIGPVPYFSTSDSQSGSTTTREEIARQT